MIKKEHVLGPNKIFVQRLIPEKKKFLSPLLFIHGSFGGFFVWQTIAGYLSERGFECLMMSLRGHKPNEAVDLSLVSMDDYVGDIRVVTEELDLENPVLVGHSLAGLLVLMYEKKFDQLKAVVSIDPSPSLEVQDRHTEEEVKDIPLVYDAVVAGMPTDPAGMMKAMPDIPSVTLMKMKEMLGSESGLARRQRKIGISVPKESVKSPLLFMGAELGASLPFGISPESTKKMAEYYHAEMFEAEGASHPGILMGVHAAAVAEKIENWLQNITVIQTTDA